MHVGVGVHGGQRFLDFCRTGLSAAVSQLTFVIELLTVHTGKHFIWGHISERISSKIWLLPK